MNTPNQPAATFQLPQIPPVPSALPGQGVSETVWATQWANYRWAIQMHSEAACRQGQADMRVALIDAIDKGIGHLMTALANRRTVTKQEVVLAMMALVPVAFRSTENNWAQEVIKAADELWEKMQPVGSLG